VFFGLVFPFLNFSTASLFNICKQYDQGGGFIRVKTSEMKRKKFINLKREMSELNEMGVMTKLAHCFISAVVGEWIE